MKGASVGGAPENAAFKVLNDVINPLLIISINCWKAYMIRR